MSWHFSLLPACSALLRHLSLLQNPETITQLTNEVKLSASLSHPNIVKINASESKASLLGGERGKECMEITVIMEYCSGMCSCCDEPRSCSKF